MWGGGVNAISNNCLASALNIKMPALEQKQIAHAQKTNVAWPDDSEGKGRREPTHTHIHTQIIHTYTTNNFYTISNF